jgi:hypothetical protein
MRKTGIFSAAFVLIISTASLRADIAAIHANALPQETAVLAALDDAKQLEPYSESWTSDWQYPVKKDEVAARLGKDLGFLELATKNHPENAELLLLTGLVARYAYNVDVDGSFDEAMSALNQAEKLMAGDYRASWFRGTLECQTRELAAGAREFLGIEAGHAWNSLPAAFWEDYLNCATVSDLPEHALRAVDYLEKLHAGTAEDFGTAININRSRLVAYDPKKSYETKEVWQADPKTGGDVVLTSSLCGLRLHARSEWSVVQLGMNNGVCVAYFNAGPYQATTRDLSPGIMVLVQRPKEGESLQDYSRKFLMKGATQPFTPSRCPSDACIAIEEANPGMYKADGDGKGRTVVFERDEPPYPGLIFESPADLPKPDGTAGVTYYRPDKFQERIPGKLYYLVLLDAAASIEGPAVKDFEYFLQNLTVE